MPTINVDQLAAYALTSQRAVLPYVLDYKQHIANSIKQAHNVTLQVVDFDLGIPVAKDNMRFNAEIGVTVKPSSGFSGSINLAYTRAPVSDIAFNRDLDTFKYVAGATTTRNMLAAFNTKFGTKIDLTEIVDEPLNASGDTLFTASPGSVFFVPGSQANMGVLVPSARDWEIPGLAWPEMYGAITIGVDFSSIKATLGTISSATSVSLVSGTANVICDAINSLTGTTLFKRDTTQAAMGGLALCSARTWTLPNASLPECDQTGKFDRVAVLTPLANGWFTKPIYIQYKA